MVVLSLVSGLFAFSIAKSTQNGMSSINASKLALEAQQYAAAEGDIIRMKPYAELNSSSKAEIAGTHFSKEISVGTESDYTDTIKKKIVTVCFKASCAPRFGLNPKLDSENCGS